MPDTDPDNEDDNIINKNYYYAFVKPGDEDTD